MVWTIDNMRRISLKSESNKYLVFKVQIQIFSTVFPYFLFGYTTQQHTQAFTVVQFPACSLRPGGCMGAVSPWPGPRLMRAATCRVPAPSGRRSVAPSPDQRTSSHSVQNIANIVCRTLQTLQCAEHCEHYRGKCLLVVVNVFTCCTCPQ